MVFYTPWIIYDQITKLHIIYIDDFFLQHTKYIEKYISGNDNNVSVL